MTDPCDERRRFARFTMDRTAHIAAAGKPFACRLVDISLRGALLSYCHDWRPEPGSKITIHIDLDEEGHHAIDMSGEVSHIGPSRLGIHITELDLDSSTNLRRLVEINLGDGDLLERELEAMIADAEGA
jgi:hypothetical protein